MAPALLVPPLVVVTALDANPELEALAPLAPPTAVPMVPPEAQLSRTSQGSPGTEESLEFSPSMVYTMGPAE